MTKYQRRCTEMFERVVSLRERFPVAFAEKSPAAAALAEVRAAKAAIDAQLIRYVGATDVPRHRAEHRLALVRALLSIVRTVRRISRDVPDVAQKFVMPEPRTDRSLLETAETFARDLGPLEQECLAFGMPATFIAELRATTDRFAWSVSRRRGARLEAAAARTAMADAFRRGFSAVMTLDVIVANANADNKVLQDTWKAARRVDRKRVRRRPSAARRTDAA